jgi:peroxiredoxin
MRDTLQPGRLFPDLELPDHAGNRRRLSEITGNDPLVLHLGHGYFCPKEREFWRMLARLQDRAEVAYTRMVSVTTEPSEIQAAFRAGLDARWTFLSDADRRYLDELGLRETTDSVNDPYTPTVFVLFPALRIHRVYDGYWFWGRPTEDELWRDLRDVTRELRRNWTPPARRGNAGRVHAPARRCAHHGDRRKHALCGGNHGGPRRGPAAPRGRSVRAPLPGTDRARRPRPLRDDAATGRARQPALWRG